MRTIRNKTTELILRSLNVAERKLNITEIADYCDLTPQTISVKIRKLEKFNLIALERQKEKNALNVEITERGESYLYLLEQFLKHKKLTDVFLSNITFIEKELEGEE